ncbi:zinc finger protein Rts2p [[Candida] railenensis]|uniref:Zinc finger protein Rts2p n=1 Tax=[Candida] railenensis TaxID=45579 RepID=A0A9P0QTY6_9ASCO|nr:zinc finger protein Rts2p [[Candida] railenensis]
MKAEFGTAKYQSKQLKISGLQKLKFYCQLCNKQCRDANGFKNHLSSPSHLGKLSQVSSDPNEDVISKYSEQFTSDFLRLLKMTHGTKKINANRYYQEYISNDRNHIHMNATKWSSLTQFIKFLGTKGHVRVENDNQDDELSFTIALIDRSPEAVKRQEELMKKKRNVRGDEEVTMKILRKQMELGKAKDVEQEVKEDDIKVKAPISSGPVKLLLTSNPTKKRKPIAKAFENSDEDEEEDNDEETKKPIKKIKITNAQNSNSKLLG